ncbi:hypothetical protein EJB05_24967, partial [Eragrostis curvula]
LLRHQTDWPSKACHRQFFFFLEKRVNFIHPGPVSGETTPSPVLRRFCVREEDPKGLVCSPAPAPLLSPPSSSACSHRSLASRGSRASLPSRLVRFLPAASRAVSHAIALSSSPTKARLRSATSVSRCVKAVGVTCYRKTNALSGVTQIPAPDAFEDAVNQTAFLC